MNSGRAEPSSGRDLLHRASKRLRLFPLTSPPPRPFYKVAWRCYFISSPGWSVHARAGQNGGECSCSAEGLAHGVAAVAHGAHQEALDSRAFRAEEEERDLHPVRGRQVVPVRGRADPLVHPRRVPPAAAAAAEAVMDRPAGPCRRPSIEHGAPTYRWPPGGSLPIPTDCRWLGVVHIKMIERASGSSVSP
uniref:Uncharacterized protein n=1 Tax=Triticum urartu TaxID=4572 RepID=A0A8R7TFE3_TRIUA